MFGDEGRPVGGAADAPLSDSQMDAFYNGTAGDSNQTRGMGDEAPLESTAPPQPAPTTPTPAPAPVVPKTWNPDDNFFAEVPWGKEKVALKGADGYKKLVAWASMGHAFNQNQQKLNAKEQTLSQKEAETLALQKYYKEIDDVAKADPKWWEHVVTSFKTRTGQPVSPTPDQYGDPASQVPPQFQAALSKIQADFDARVARLEGDVKLREQEALTQKEAAEDAQLEEQITNFKSTYPDFDWGTPDEKGLVLVDRIVIHAKNQGIQNFQAAARDLLWDDALGRSKLKGKEELTDTLKRQRGADGKFMPTQPTAPAPAPRNVNELRPPSRPNMSYGELIEEGLRELGVA